MSDSVHNFETTDLPIAAYLLTRGTQFMGTKDGISDRSTVFILRGGEQEINDRIAEFDGSEAQAFDNKMRFLKTASHSRRGFR